MKHPDLSLEIEKVRTTNMSKDIPFIIDYIVGKSVLSTKRPP